MLDAKSFYARLTPCAAWSISWTAIRQMPVDELGMVELIPLEEYAPAQADDPASRATWQKRGPVVLHQLRFGLPNGLISPFPRA